MRSPVARECGAFGVAEIVSMATSLGVVAIADQVIPKSIQNTVYQSLGKILEPTLLDPFEKVKSKFCKLEECKTDPNKSREQRSEDMAKLLVVFGSAWVISMAAKLKTRRWLNKSFNVMEDLHMPKLEPNASLGKKLAFHTVPWVYWSPEERLIFAADEGIHYGSIFLMNNQLSPVTDEMIRSATNVIHKITGFDEKKSREIADMLIIWEMPNFLGMFTGFGAIAGKHKLGWPQKNQVLSKVFGGSVEHSPS